MLAVAGCEDPKISEAKEAVGRKLKDASTAQFRDMRICEQNGFVQGEVNAKNSFGAYAGFTPFVSRGRYSAYLDGPDAIDREGYLAALRNCVSDEMWNRLYPDGTPPGMDPEFFRKMVAILKPRT
ncbi:hypothetical protein HY78_08665 [Rhizorhabdus wittichii DC-6]|nr:hypothetical protein HY78_08665 [Rhizorhabdus wittichii DC-6]